MNTSNAESDGLVLWRLTADQRQQIYEEEKRRMEQSAPKLSRNAKTQISVYLLGCVLIYFGIVQSLMNFARTRQWSYRPETDFPLSLFNAVWELARPLAAGYLFGVPCYLVVFLFWESAPVLLKFLKRKNNRDNEPKNRI